jgi:hypothetical protein
VIFNQGAKTMDFSDQKQTYYGIKSNGVVSGRYTNPLLAEQAKQQLSESEQTTAMVVAVGADGREMLFS